MPLINDLTKLINESHQYAWDKFWTIKRNPETFGHTEQTVGRWKTPGEPAFVSALLEYSVDNNRLSTIISNHLQTKHCSKPPFVSGVFIHQKPKVSFSGNSEASGSIEIGDLLLVRQHFILGNPNPESVAFLLQAKTSSTPETGSLSGNEKQQFDLYANWPEFHFVHKGFGQSPSNTTDWDFKIGLPQVCNSGYYGIISNTQEINVSWKYNCSWVIGEAKTQCTPPSVSASHSLPVAMEKFLKGEFGRPWDSTTSLSDNDHWSTFIIRCLASAAGWRHYPVQRRSNDKFPRQRDFKFLAPTALVSTVKPIFGRWHVSQLPMEEEVAFQNMQKKCAMAITDIWLNSLTAETEDGFPPNSAENPENAPSSGGISILYVATFGESSLKD